MLEEHLGGHNNKTHIDIGALTWLQSTFNIKSFLDIGCGTGGMVELANKAGLQGYGIDGDYTLERYNPNKFLIHDFTTGPAPLENNYDIGWSVEFLEHVHEEYMPNYMHSFQQCKYVVITYAPPGWNGHHHVNLQEEGYWIKKFKEYGLIYSETYTNELRDNSTMNYPKKPRKAFVKNRGLFLVNAN